MAVMSRSLLVGALAWILGNAALWSFPSASIRLDRVGDWVSMVLFHPFEILLSLCFFLLASFLLFGLLHFHIGQSYYRRSSADVWLHVFLCFFSLFVFTIQFVKMPVPTTVLTFIAILYAIGNKGQLFLGKRRN